MSIFRMAFAVLVFFAMSPGWAQQSSGFSLLPRTGVTFPVPSFRPAAPNLPIALDIFPSGPNPVEQGDNGWAWFDACNTDMQYTAGLDPQNQLPGIPVTCARLGVRSGFIEIGSRAFYGAPDLDTCIVRGRVKIACFRSWGLEVFGTVKAINFTTN